MKYLLHLFLFTSLLSCHQDYTSKQNKKKILISQKVEKEVANISEQKIINDISPPNGYSIINSTKESYSHYIQNLPLKPKGSKIKYFDGRVKSFFNDYVAVLDLPIGNKDLHQCADAVMRLRADYLWYSNQYDQIHFNFTNGMRVDYSNWMQGQRIKVDGNRTYWYQAKEASNQKEDYWQYLEQIWMFAGTLSLSKELVPRDIKNISIGDVFIQGGTPGHAITVVNIAKHETTNEKLFLLAQSYMPAQEIHILTNPQDELLSPWYSNQEVNQIITPEWTFAVEDLMYFKN